MYGIFGAFIGAILGFLIGSVTRPTIFSTPLPLSLMFGDDYYQVGETNMAALQTHMWSWIAICAIIGMVGGVVFGRFNGAPAGEINPFAAELGEAPLSVKMADMAAARRSGKPVTPQPIAEPRNSYKFDEKRWDTLLATDPAVSAAADEVRALGLEYEDELAAKYLAAKNKAQLPKIVEAIRKKADAADT